MTIQERVYYTISDINFSVHSLLQYIVSVTYTLLLLIDMMSALKHLIACSKQPACV